MKNNLSKSYLFLVILLLVTIFGCHNNASDTKTNQSDTTKSLTKAVAEKSFSNSNCDSTIVNQELSFNALAFQVFKADTNKIKSLFLDNVVIKMENK